MAALMENKQVYDFQTYVPSILGTAFKHVEIAGYLPYDSALLFNGELTPIHAEIYSTGQLPEGTPNDPRQYNYYIVKKPDGSTTVIGEAWIDASTIVPVSVKTAHITVPGASTSDMVKLRNMLAQAGYVDFTIEFD